MKLGVDLRCLQDKTRTGVGEYAWQTLKYLETDKLISIIGWANAAGHLDLPTGLVENIKVKRGHIPNKLMNLMLWLNLGPTIDQLLEKDHDKLDVLWLPNPSFAQINHKIPTLLTVHDLSFIHYPHFFPYKGHLWYFPAVKKLLKRGLPKTSLIAAVSEHTAADIAQQFPQLKNKIRVAPPGLDPRYFFTPEPNIITAVRKKYQLPAQYLLSLGTIEPRKNYPFLLTIYDELIKRQPDFPADLVIAGGWGWRFQAVKKLLTKLKSRARIKFIGYVPDEDKPVIYSQAELFLFPSLYEGLGLPPLEAMASGLPVIASQNSSLPEVVGEAGILLSPYLPVTWCQTIDWLIHDRSARLTLQERGLKRAKMFSWQKTAQFYKNTLNELAAKS